jgi:HEAT repeat protein
MRLSILVGLVLLASGCSSPSTDDWLAQLSDPDVVKRRQAIRELASRIAEPDRIVPALTEALRDENGYVRHDAAWAIGNFGAEAQQALPALVVALKDEARNVRIAATSALKKIDPVAAKMAEDR